MGLLFHPMGLLSQPIGISSMSSSVKSLPLLAITLVSVHTGLDSQFQSVLIASCLFRVWPMLCASPFTTSSSIRSVDIPALGFGQSQTFRTRWSPYQGMLTSGCFKSTCAMAQLCVSVQTLCFTATQTRPRRSVGTAKGTRRNISKILICTRATRATSSAQITKIMFVTDEAWLMAFRIRPCWIKSRSSISISISY